MNVQFANGDGWSSGSSLRLCCGGAEDRSTDASQNTSFGALTLATTFGGDRDQIAAALTSALTPRWQYNQALDGSIDLRPAGVDTAGYAPRYLDGRPHRYPGG